VSVFSQALTLKLQAARSIPVADIEAVALGRGEFGAKARRLPSLGADAGDSFSISLKGGSTRHDLVAGECSVMSRTSLLRFGSLVIVR
jgi:hypothetical protein